MPDISDPDHTNTLVAECAQIPTELQNLEEKAPRIEEWSGVL